MKLLWITVILVIVAVSNCKRVHVELSDGGTSRPIITEPLTHNHHDKNGTQVNPHSGSKADTISMNDLSDEKVSENSDLKKEDSKYTPDFNDIPQRDQPVDGSLYSDYDETPTISSKEQGHEDKDGSMTTNSSDLKLDITDTKTNQAATTTSAIMVGSTTADSLTTTTKPFHKSSTSATLSSSSTIATVSTQEPKLCHKECVKTLNTSRLYSPQNSAINFGSDLTLVCELSKNPFYIVEELIWLYHPNNTPIYQCSLTTHETIPLCKEFGNIQVTNDSNDTFIRESITLRNMLLNHSGQYMCQIKIICCPGSTEQDHFMIKELIHEVIIIDYTIDLAVAGSIAAALALIVMGGSYYLSRRQQVHYVFISDDIHQEIKPRTVLHLPLVEDQDNDSFDSNFDGQD